MKRLPLILLVATVAIFIAGLGHLLKLRFEVGDVFSPYSSLRADPLGAKAFYESLNRFLTVQRNYDPLLKLGESRDTTFFVLGLDPRELRSDPEELKQLEAFVANGGRMVIALFPRFQQGFVPWYERESSRKVTNSPSARRGTNAPVTSKATNAPSAKTEKKKPRPTKKSPFSDDEDDDRPPQIPLGERWKFELKYASALRDEKGVFKPVIAELKPTAALPTSLEWHSAAWFDKLDPAWRVIYAREKGHAVAVERTLGRGTIVLLTDSYYFSNEALRQGHHADWLAWLVGPNHRVIFEEAHLGVQENPGVATLARKYGLHGLFIALLVLAGLFIWKNSLPFMPPPEEQVALERGDHVTGKESAAGFVNLLRRNIRGADVLATCFAEWKKSCGRTVPAAKLQQAEALMAADVSATSRERNPVQTYRNISQLLAKPTLKS